MIRLGKKDIQQVNRMVGTDALRGKLPENESPADKTGKNLNLSAPFFRISLEYSFALALVKIRFERRRPVGPSTCKCHALRRFGNHREAV
jgi:hypothetical protein